MKRLVVIYVLGGFLYIKLVFLFLDFLSFLRKEICQLNGKLKLNIYIIYSGKNYLNIQEYSKQVVWKFYFILFNI